MSSGKILLVEDEPSISKLVEFNLKSAGFDVLCVFDGATAMEYVKRYDPDLIVLDVMLPKMDGIQVCRELRRAGNMVPIIMLSALQELSDKLAGLDNGADDYMSKPFSPQELVSRIHALLRRSRAQSDMCAGETFVIGEMKIRPEQHEVLLKDKPVDLTPKEKELLFYLLKHRGKVLSRDRLLQEVWGYDLLGNTRVVDVHISHLRDKLEADARNPEYILTVRNVGYKLSGTAPAR